MRRQSSRAPFTVAEGAALGTWFHDKRLAKPFRASCREKVETGTCRIQSEVEGSKRASLLQVMLALPGSN